MFRPPRMRPAAPPRLLNDDEMLHIGLEQVGFDLYRQNSVSRATNVLRFVSHYGSTPLVCAAVWEDLITTEIPEAKIAAGTAPDKFFLGMYFLKVYPTEEKLAACFKVCEKAARKWAWIFACKIQALKAKKVSCYSSSSYIIMHVPSLLRRSCGQKRGPTTMLTMTHCHPFYTRWMGCTVGSMKQSIQLMQRTQNFFRISLIKLELDTSWRYLFSTIRLCG
jgi:hypothetical protein